MTLSRDGLLRVDSLLPRFFKPEHSDGPIHVALAIVDFETSSRTLQMTLKERALESSRRTLRVEIS